MEWRCHSWTVRLTRRPPRATAPPHGAASPFSAARPLVAVGGVEHAADSTALAAVMGEEHRLRVQLAAALKWSLFEVILPKASLFDKGSELRSALDGGGRRGGGGE